jgi:predicted nucleic acid-binding protein
MILVDTGVWSHHFRTGEPALAKLLRDDLVVTHPWVAGELALGHGLRLEVLSDIAALRRVPSMNDDDLLAWVRMHRIRGVGWVDAQLLASTLRAGALLWTTDRGLAELAARFEVGWVPG